MNNSKPRKQQQKKRGGFKAPRSSSKFQPSQQQMLLNPHLLRSAQNGWFDDFAEFAKEMVPYYKTAQTILDNPISKGIIKHAPKLGQKAIDFMFPKGKEAVKAMQQEIKSEVKQDLKSSGFVDKNVIFGPSKSVSFQSSPKLTKRNGATWLTGGELHSVITAPGGGYASGDLIKSVDLNPATINLPVLRSHIKTFEQFWFKRLTVTVVGGSGNNATGTFVIVYDPDPRDTWTVSSSETAKRATNAKYKTIARPFDISHLEVPSREKPLLYIDNELGQERFESLGHLAIVCLNPIAANTPIGALYISYDVELISSQTDPDITTGDFVAWNCSGSFSTSAMMNSGLYSPYSSIQLTSWSDEDQKNGYINLPAGSYRVSVSIGSASGLTYSPALWSVVQTGQYAPWADSTYMSQMDAASGAGSTLDRWVGCLSPFRVKLNITGGTWTFANFWISAVSANPYTATQRSLERLNALVDAQKGTEKSLQLYKKDVQKSEDWHCVSDEEKSSSTTSSSTSSTSSSSSGSMCSNRVTIVRKY